MRKTITLLFVLLVQLTARAEMRDGHFFKTLQSENLTEEKAMECFNKWFALPQETEWRKVGERTDRLGMTRVEYRQYVSGVEVEHSQVLLHMKDGRVQIANGTVMEVPQAPARLRRYAKVYRDGTPTDQLGRKLYLVSTRDGYRYATKALSADKSEWIYTDADTDEVLMRIPTRYSLTAEPVKVTGRSIYSGEVQMDASYDSESSTYLLWDQQRNIHTMIAATLPSWEELEKEVFVANFPQFEDKLPVPMEEMTDEMWQKWLDMIFDNWNWDEIELTTYITRNAIYATSTESCFDSYILGTVTIDRLASRNEDGTLTGITASEDKPFDLCTEVCYIGTDGMIERSKNTVTSFPFTLDLKAFYDEVPTAGIDIKFYSVETVDDGNGGTKTENRLLSYVSFTPDGSGHVEWDTELAKASATYEKGPWSATDIHWGMQHTYDFFLKYFDRNSYDDNGASIFNLFYLPDNNRESSYVLSTPLNNAMAVNCRTSQMAYGMGARDGGKTSLYPVVELSVMAHEFTHMVTNATARLVYHGESGALNESFSDLMGISVKKYVFGNDSPWIIGEGVGVEFTDIRSMSSPKTSKGGKNACPDTYKGEFWVDTESEDDGGGIHTNSGVQNKWYYLLTDGGSGTNDNDYSYQVESIGLEKSQQIAYRTLVEYATQESQYADIRLASLQAAEDLYGANSDEVKTVDEAWKAVGVGGQQTAINEVEGGPETSDRSVYDLLGRQIVNSKSSNCKLPQGLYIIGGKKVVVNK